MEDKLKYLLNRITSLEIEQPSNDDPLSEWKKGFNYCLLTLGSEVSDLMRGVPIVEGGGDLDEVPPQYGNGFYHQLKLRELSETFNSSKITMKDLEEAADYILKNTPFPKSERTLKLMQYCKGVDHAVYRSAENPNLCGDNECLSCMNIKEVFKNYKL